MERKPTNEGEGEGARRKARDSQEGHYGLGNEMTKKQRMLMVKGAQETYDWIHPISGKPDEKD